MLEVEENEDEGKRKGKGDRCYWHHHPDGSTMQLVDRLIHRQTGHSGGRQITGGRP